MAAMTELPPGFKVDSEPDGLPPGFVVDSGEEISRQAAKAQGGEGLQEGFVVDLPAGDELPAGFTVDGAVSGAAEAVGAPGNFNIQRPTSNIQHPTPNETLGGLAALREEAMTPEERAATGMVTLAPSPLGTVEEMLAANRAGTVADFDGAATDRAKRYGAWEDATREYASFAESSPLTDSPVHAELRGRVKAAWAGLSPEDQRAIEKQNQAIGFAESLPAFIVPGPQLAGLGTGIVRRGVEGGLKMAQAGAAEGAVEDGFAGAARGAVEGFVTGLGLGAAGKAPLATLVGFTKLGMAQGLDGDEALGNAFAMWATGAALGAGGRTGEVSRQGAKAQGGETVGAPRQQYDRAFYTDLVRRARAGDAGARARIAELVGAGTAESRTPNIERRTSNIEVKTAEPGPVTMPPAVRKQGEVIGRGTQEGQEGLPVGPAPVAVATVPPTGTSPVGGQAPVVTPTPEGARVEVPMPEKKAAALGMKEQKKFLLEEVDKAIEAAWIDGETTWPRNNIVDALQPFADKAGVGLQDYFKKYEIDDKTNPGKVVIEVPGDGTFTVRNTKQALLQFKERVARKFPVKKAGGTATRVPSGRTGRADYIQRGMDDAIALYGNAEEAARRIEAQIERVKDYPDSYDLDGAREVVEALKAKDENGRTFEIQYKDMNDEWQNVSVVDVSYDRLPDKLRKQVDLAAERGLQGDGAEWIRIQEKRRKVTLQTKRNIRTGEQSQSLRLETPDEVFTPWAERGDLQEARYNERGGLLRDLLAVRRSKADAEAAAKKNKAKADEADYDRRRHAGMDALDALAKKAKFKKATIRIAMTDGPPVERAGMQYRHLHIAKNDAGLWAVTHVTTGFRLGEYVDQRSARVAAVRLADLIPAAVTAEGAKDLPADVRTKARMINRDAYAPIEDAPSGPGADVEAAAASRGQRGAVMVPERQALGRALRAIRAQFSTTQGMPRNVHTAFVRMHDALEATRYGRRQAEESIRRMVHGLEAVAPRDRIMADVGEVQTGGMTPADFGARYNLPPTSPEVRALEEMKRSIFDAAQEIAKWEGLSPESQERIRQNIHYVTRRYLRMIQGSDYRPPATAVADAVTEVENGLLASVSKLERQATAVRGRRGQVDVVQWLNTGDPAFLVGVSRTRAAAAQRLRRNWIELRDLIDTMALNGNAVTAQVNADAVKGAADGIVGYYLGRDVQGMGRHGGIDIGNLSRRFLESTAFRKLYGEITDPAARYGATVETQGALLAQMAFMNRVLAEGEGTVWAIRPDPARGLTERLGEPSNGADRRRYGDLVGRYVTPEFLSMVAGDPNRGPVARVFVAAYSAPMAVTRLAHLLNPRTVMRNWYTSWIGNGLASGDMLNPTYFKRWAEAHAIAAKHVWGSVQRVGGKQPGPAGQEALAELKRAAELGYYTAGQNSFTMDMQIAMGGVGAKARGAGRKIARAYAMIDFMSKYASYWSCIDSGMTPEQARVHVAEMYQNKYRIPRIASKVSATGLADYLPYTADSVRFTWNHVRNAVDRLRHGDPRAMIGLALSRAMLWALALGAGDMITRGFSALHRAIRGNKSQGDGTLGPQDQDAMRDFVAKYDRNMPLLSWYERDPVKGRVVYYAVAGGQSAFPVDDWFVGALQSREHGQSFLSALAHNSAQQVDLGMYPSMILTGMVGQDFMGSQTRTGKGVVQAIFGREDPRRAQILKDALAYMGTEFSGVSALKALARLTKMEAEQRAGVEQVGPFRETKTEADILASAVRMVRVYRVERPDMNRALARRVKEYAEALGTAHGMISTDLKKNLVRGGSTADDKNAAALAAEARPRYINRMAEFVRSARKVMPEWYGDADLQMLLTADEAGLNGLDAMEVIRRSKTEPGKAGPVPAYMPAPRIRPYQFMRD